MDDLVQWLGQQIDDDERIARAASPGPWRANAEHDEVLAVDEITVAEGFALSGGQLRATVDHIAEHDPARVLREIDAKRQALAQYARVCELTMDGAEAYLLAEGVAAKQIQIMATAYCYRPGYREEWRP